ncbi:MAG: UDP-N-acetylmuramoyl-L-alanine--D-glutamate ligase [Anaerovoracaceae bacterium]
MVEYYKNLKGKKVLVVGLGKSGIAAIKALLKFGSKVTIQDSKKQENVDKKVIDLFEKANISYFFGEKPEDISEYDLIVVSPGVPLNVDFLVEAKGKGIEIIGELELAYRCGKGKYIAITGTNGKTTTTSLVGEIFKNAQKESVVVGNIGVAVMNEATAASDDTWLITETSSFQLETISEFKPQVSAILNLTPDHMDRHKTMEAYGESKAKIMENQDNDQYVVINFDDKECLKLVSGTKAKVVPFSRIEPLIFGAFVKDDKIVIINEDEDMIEFCRADELKIPGSHNLENALAAAAIAYFAGIDKDVITETLKNFGGVSHRLEFCGEIDGIQFVNDSKGTNPDAAIKAIEAMKTGIVLIAGGYDKNSNFDSFVDSFGDKVKHVVLLGTTAVKIKEAAERKGYQNTIMVKDMKACVSEAFRRAETGDTVLLSPACASWDMYNSFEERGDDFKNCVKELEK